MNWVNIDSLKEKFSALQNASILSSLNSPQSSPDSQKPKKRWGQVCVEANKMIYIIGGYEGMTHF